MHVIDQVFINRYTIGRGNAMMQINSKHTVDKFTCSNIELLFIVLRWL